MSSTVRATVLLTQDLRSAGVPLALAHTVVGRLVNGWNEFVDVENEEAAHVLKDRVAELRGVAAVVLE